MTSNTVMVNLTAVHPRVMDIVPFSISYDADVDKARSIAVELAANHPQSEDVVGCPVMLLNASSVDISLRILSLRIWCAGPSVAWTVQVELTE